MGSDTGFQSFGSPQTQRSQQFYKLITAMGQVRGAAWALSPKSLLGNLEEKKIELL